MSKYSIKYVNEFEKLSDKNKVLINFDYYVENENGELGDSYFEQLEEVLYFSKDNGYISKDTLAVANNLITELSSIIRIASDNMQLDAERKLKIFKKTIN